MVIVFLILSHIFVFLCLLYAHSMYSLSNKNVLHIK